MMFTSLILIICTGLSRRLSEQQWCLYHWFQYYVADYQDDWASSNDVYIVDFNNMYRTIKTIERAAMMFTSLILVICTGLSRRLSEQQWCLYHWFQYYVADYQDDWASSNDVYIVDFSNMYRTIKTIERAAMMSISLTSILCSGLSRRLSEQQWCLHRWWASSNSNMYRTIKTIERAAMMSISLISILCNGLSRRLSEQQWCLHRWF